MNFAITFSRFFDDHTVVTTAKPLRCSGKECLSVYVTGGLVLVSPWPANLKQHPEADSIILEGEQILHLEFEPVEITDVTLSDDNCKFWGTPAYGIYFCIWSNADQLDARSFPSVSYS